MPGIFPKTRPQLEKVAEFQGKREKRLEVETGESIVTPENYLIESESRKRLSMKKKKTEK